MTKAETMAEELESEAGLHQLLRSSGPSIWASLPDASKQLQAALEGAQGSSFERSAIKSQAIQAVTRLLKTSTGQEDDKVAGKTQALNALVMCTSRCVLGWVEAGAAVSMVASSVEQRAFPSDILASCCSYMESLATARPERFAADCQSLGTPVAAVLMHEAMPSKDTSDEQASSGHNGHHGTNISPKDQSGAAVRVNLWVDLLGICLLPFCAGDGGQTQSVDDRNQQGEFDSDDDTDSDDEGDSLGHGLPSGRMRSGWVRGSLRRAEEASSGVEPLECPFDCRPGGKDAELTVRLTGLVSSYVKDAAQASRPSSVSSLATVLAVLCAFTAGEQVGAFGSHGEVVAEAFACLGEVANKTPEGTAEAECVKAALIALKECSEVARPSTLPQHVPLVLSVVEGVPAKLKLLLARTKGQDPKSYSTALSFCRQARAAAIACSRTVIRRAGAEFVAANPDRFLREFVVSMASPLLLADAVRALRVASLAGGDGLEGVDVTHALRGMVLPGAVERLTKALESIDRYSTAATVEVLKAISELAKAAGGELRPYQAQLGIALVEGATGGRSSRKGGDEKLRLCLKAIRCICASSMQIHNASQTLTARSLGSSAAGAAVNSGSPDASERFAEEAFELSLGVVEGEWTGDAGREGGGVRAGDEPSIVTVVEAHRTLAALLRSGLRVPGITADGDWPETAKRVALLARAIAERIRSAGCAGAMYPLADDDIMLLCQGAEVLEATTDGASAFFVGSESSAWSGKLSQVLTTLRSTCDEGSLHPVVLDACSWVRSRC